MRNTQVEIICQYTPCSRAFFVKQSEIARGTRQYCSYQCKGLGTRIDPEKRFWSYVHKTDSCWLWTGASLKAGYGILGISGRSPSKVLAHRYSWELAFGPIPDGLFVLHDCPTPEGDNPACVNPSHLWLGTDLDNSTDKCNKQRQARGETQGGSKLTTAIVYEIRSMEGKLTPTQAAKRYKVSKVTIWRIWRRKIWDHLPEIESL